MNKLNAIDLFAGCGGLSEGFEQSKLYNVLAYVEWEKAPCENLKKHLIEKWHIPDADKRVLRFDIQRTEELFHGWNDKEYGSSDGLDALLHDALLDVVIGGPPCQAYSLAGRVRDVNGMRDDYRNFLFESYIEVVKRYKPKAFVFENVPGILSAAPTGKPIIEIIKETFREAGYVILDNLSEAVVDFSEYGLPQKRKRMIILGLRSEIYGDRCMEMVKEFYSIILPKHKVQHKSTVREAIGDLPPLYPLDECQKIGRGKCSHSFTDSSIPNHIPRYHNSRDQGIFSLLADDIESGRNEYVSSDALRKLYTEITGRTSNIHKYYVLRWNQESNLIPAHLYKDGLRHIHPDAKQARSITVREAARLQGFPDDYEFIGTQADQFKMIGNAVPPVFSVILAEALHELIYQK
ncbi:MAG: DNA cytosine methyltransferase [Methanocorpusculum parvum]|nr:DNA cytosine methyltransferase [Methanocorpusculum parvum]